MRRDRRWWWLSTAARRFDREMDEQLKLLVRSFATQQLLNSTAFRIAALREENVPSNSDAQRTSKHEHVTDQVASRLTRSVRKIRARFSTTLALCRMAGLFSSHRFFAHKIFPRAAEIEYQRLRSNSVSEKMKLAGKAPVGAV